MREVTLFSGLGGRVLGKAIDLDFLLIDLSSFETHFNDHFISTYY